MFIVCKNDEFPVGHAAAARKGVHVSDHIVEVRPYAVASMGVFQAVNGKGYGSVGKMGPQFLLPVFALRHAVGVASQNDIAIQAFQIVGNGHHIVIGRKVTKITGKRDAFEALDHLARQQLEVL